jgi:tRNA nucleotidyltransferase (CCA-adding enzyme)
MKIEKSILKISKYLQKNGAKAIVVGGSVRDFLFKKEPKDFDIEVYGVSLKKLQELLSHFGKVLVVGKSFGVLKLFFDGKVYDFSLPRKEKKVASGHRGFKVTCDENLEYKEAFKRRDFTINAIGYDIQNGFFIDIYGGIKDLEQKILRVVCEKTFVEDPLRVYRAVQFVARFELEVEPKTKELLKMMVKRGDLEELPKERVFEEFKKLLLKAKKPSIGLELLKELGVLKYFPELKAIVGVKQDPIYHLESDVWTHTLKALDALEKRELKLAFAVLCYNLTKAVTTKVIDGKLTLIGHKKAGVLLSESFLRRLTDDKKLIEGVLSLVRWHFVPSAFYKQKAKNKAIRRLSTKVNIKELIEVAKADFFGRGTDKAKSGVYEAGEWLLKRAKKLGVENSPPKPFVRGGDLIDMGLEPSPLFKKILDEMYQKQLDGELENREKALKYLKEKISSII